MQRELEKLGIHPSLMEPALEAASRSVTVNDEVVLPPLLKVEQTPQGRSVASYRLAEAEGEIATQLRARLGEVPAGDVRGCFGDLEPSEDQARALALLLSSKIACLTGGPGTGKTTLTLALLEGLRGVTIGLAPTGKAARRMSEVTGLECATIHSWLVAENIACDNVIVDEASMLDTEIGAALLSRIPTTARIYLVGDVDQLPSIAPGAVFRDIIASGVVPVARLERIHRQSATSCIPDMAREINHGRVGEFGGDCLHVECADAGVAAQWVLRYLYEDLPAYMTRLTGHVVAPKDIQVIAPMRKGSCGTIALNLLIQDRETGGQTFEDDIPIRGYKGTQVTARKGDRVINKKNDRELRVVNGDIGIVQASNLQGVDVNRWEDLQTRSEGKAPIVIVVEYPDGTATKTVGYTRAQARMLDLGYAITVHSAQGSQFPGVLMVVHSSHETMLTRGVVYTGLTRASDCAVIVGEMEALTEAAKVARDASRVTRLVERLRSK